MNETTHNQGGRLFSPANDVTNQRILRSMLVVSVVAFLISLPAASWRISLGLLIGGVLSLINHYWLTTSSNAAFAVLVDGEKPRLSLLNYLLRYGLIGFVILIVYQLHLASVPAILAGLCSFVVALFIEAGREFYFAIIHREETI